MIAKLGFGVSGPLGLAWFGEGKARALIRGAIAGGIRHFDTAPFYADAEERLGAALRDIGAENVFISTKTGTRRIGRRLVKNFTPEGMRADVESSLARLGRERVDLLYLHGPSVRDIDAARPALERLKVEGKLARIGVCGEGAPIDHAIASGFDVVMAPFNLLDRRHEAAFVKARAQGMMTVAITPLAQALFTRGFFVPRTPSDVWRMARALVRRRARFGEAKAARLVLEGIEGWSPAAAALQFVIANPAVSVAVTTTTKIGHLQESITAAGRRLDPTALAAIDRLALDRAGPRS